MKKILLILSMQAVVLMVTPAATADSFSYNFSSSDNSVTLNATFTAAAVSPGSEVYNISAMTGSYTDTNFGIVSQPITALVQNAGPSGPFLTPDGLFFYDNLLDPDGLVAGFDGSVLDETGGVAFDLADGSEISFSGAGGGFYFAYESPDGVNVNSPGEFIQVNAPTAVTAEPPSLVLLGTGLLGMAIGLHLFTRKRKTDFRFAD